jgi:5-methylcytosine-specific restriction enzyme subunit McrC
MNIPIRNLYYLLTYAWDALDESELIEIDALPDTHVLDLLGGVLNRGIEHLLRRGLDRGYVPRREVISGVRGKLDLSATVKVNLLRRARAVCEFDELSHDVGHNRLLRATVQRLLRAPGLDPTLCEGLAATERRLHGIGAVPLSDRAFRSVQLHSNNRFYRFLLGVCRLVHDSLLVDEASGEVRFRDFVRDERRMRRLFEQFVRNFYGHEQSIYTVCRERIRWGDTAGAPAALRLLPVMVTDISLIAADRKIVIDAKFYRETLQRHFGKESVRSAHLYQLLAYLLNLEARGGLDARAEGILLYPTVGRGVDLSYRMHGHIVRVCTIDLGQHWEGIRRDLLAMLA